MNKYNLFFTLLLAISALLFTLGVVKKVRHLHGEGPGAAPMTAQAAGPKLVIAVIPKGTINMWWEVVHKGALKAAQEFSVEITWNGPETETDREKEIQAVEDALIKKVSAVVIGPNDFKALARPIEKIHAAGIPCVVIDSAVDTDQYDAFAGTDNVAGGAMAAKLLGEALGGKGEVLLIKYVQNSASTDGRAQGFREALAKDFPRIRIVSEQYTAGTVEDARQKTVDLLTRFPNVAGVFAVNQPSAVGAYKALQTQGAAGRVKYVGFDSDPVLLKGIEAGEVQALVVQNPFQIGYLGVQAAVRLLHGEKVERSIPVPSMVVEAKNLEQMKKDFPEALGL